MPQKFPPFVYDNLPRGRHDMFVITDMLDVDKDDLQETQIFSVHLLELAEDQIEEILNPADKYGEKEKHTWGAKTAGKDPVLFSYTSKTNPKRIVRVYKLPALSE